MTNGESDVEGQASQSLRVPAEEYFKLLLETLDGDPEKRVSFRPGGNSMKPTFRDRQDVVYLGLCDELRVGDVLLYRGADGRYMLHRLIQLRGDGSCVFCGDAHTKLEAPIPRENVIAKAFAFERGSLRVDCRRSLAYRVYSRLWTASRIARASVKFCARSVREVITRLGKTCIFSNR